MLIRDPYVFSPVVHRTLPCCQRLAAMARAAAKRSFAGDGPAQGMAQGRAETPLEGGRCRFRLLDARRGRRAALPFGQRGTRQRVRAGARRQGWQTRLGKVGNPRQNPNFPSARSTPTVEGEFLYALGSDGDLACLDVGTGKVRWNKNLRTDFGGKPGQWAYAESPLIDGETLVCTPGGSEATLVALNKKTGDLLWKCAVPEGDEAAYASAIFVEVEVSGSTFN